MAVDRIPDLLEDLRSTFTNRRVRAGVGVSRPDQGGVPLVGPLSFSGVPSRSGPDMIRVMRNETTYTIDTPFHFWDDHDERCDSQAVVVKRLRQGSMVRLDITGVEIADLHSDAEYYADFDGVDRQDNFGIVNSAQATLRHLAKQFTADELAEFSRAWDARQRAEREAYQATPEYAEAIERQEREKVERERAKVERAERMARGDYRTGDWIRVPGRFVDRHRTDFCMVEVAPEVPRDGELRVWFSGRSWRVSIREAMAANRVGA